MKKMIMAVVPRDHGDPVVEALVDAGYSLTFSESRGGMLRQSQKTLFIVVEEKDLEDALSIIHTHCRTCSQVEEKAIGGAQELEHGKVTAELGGAVIFTWDVERSEDY